jgi:hypothetical protein
MFRRVTTALTLLAALVSFTTSADAEPDTTAAQLPGGPLAVYVGPRGQCQSSYVVDGTVDGNFFPGGAPYAFSPVGDCGLFLAFPATASEQPAALRGKTFGFEKHAGPSPDAIYTPVSQALLGGDGSAASPYIESTVFKVETGGEEDAVVTETTTYVDGAAQFSSTYAVKNVAKSPIYFRAMYAGDLFTDGDDQGVGVFLGGPPRFVGALSSASGVLGGLQEQPAPALPWSAFEELAFADVWSRVTATVEDEAAFKDAVEPNEVDDAVGVEWDQFRTAGLPSGQEASFSIVNRTQVPTGLDVQPSQQTHTVGQTAAVTVTAADTAGAPYANRPIVYSIGGANPKTGSVTTNASGVATIGYVGTVAGLDTMQLFLDLASSGSLTPQDPAASAQITWAPAAPTPNSGYRVQSVHASSNGTVTIALVPRQDGTALAEVTVPTATISRATSAAKRQKRCEKNETPIKGRCRPKTTVSGRASAKGRAGVSLKIAVEPSRELEAALKHGKQVALAAKLTYRSALGGTPTAQTFHFTVKARSRKQRRR